MKKCGVGALALVLAFVSATALSMNIYAESKVASPAFGDPVNAKLEKIEGDAAKCKPGEVKGETLCAVRGYRCYQGAKRAYYVENSSECGVEEDEIIKDKNGNELCVTDSEGNCKLDKYGDVIKQRKTTMWYLNQVINVVLGVMGVVSVAMIIVGGIQYTTSQGDAAKAQKAQKTILFSVVGLIVSLLAFAIVNFVLTSVFKG